MTDFLLSSFNLPAALLAGFPPFISFGVILLFLRARPKASAIVSLVAIAVSFLSATFLLFSNWHMAAPLQYTGRWLASDAFFLPFGFLLDPVSLLMLVVVTTICLLVQIYSIGYMEGDSGFSRYYAFMSLFAWAMICLTLSPTLLQLYIFWELVGLSSYLLIGFWYEKFSATQAGKKAFVMTRAGDVAFFLGLLLVLYAAGNLNILELNDPITAARMSPGLLTLCAILIFGGIIGKSAQFPLMTWLPDAMEGPTPVSALLHSATMVAAGVFLFGRLFPFLGQSAMAMSVFMTIGTISMLLAATMAMTTRDIKQVWAYSTISQLGLMIMGLAAGSQFSGIFHLTTHAGFKALLFLCSGVFIHTFNTNDAVTLGRRGSRRLRIPTICLIIGASALAGLPPFSGFFSKETIVLALAHLENPIWLAAAVLGIFLTAYYTFRLIFMLVAPDRLEAGSDHAEGHSGAAYGFMAGPLVVLAGISLLLGFCQGGLETFLPGKVMAPGADRHISWLPYLCVGLSGVGVGIAWLEFGHRRASRKGFVERVPSLSAFFAERWYLDRLYRWLVDQALDRGISRLCAENDHRVIDGGIDGMGRGITAAGRLVSLLHTGMIQYRLLAMFAVMVLLALYFFL
ncbi:MAG: NADH-quinone oxidoreductase subunit L [Pseudomonadota bacterium]